MLHRYQRLSTPRARSRRDLFPGLVSNTLGPRRVGRAARAAPLEHRPEAASAAARASLRREIPRTRPQGAGRRPNQARRDPAVRSLRRGARPPGRRGGTREGRPDRIPGVLTRTRSGPPPLAAGLRTGSPAMGTLVDYATDKGVALLTLNDPPVNAYTHEMLKELDACILEARFDDDVHVIVDHRPRRQVSSAPARTSTCSGRRTRPSSTTSASTPTRRCSASSTRRSSSSPRINGHCRRRRPRDRARLRPAHRARRATSRSACPRWTSASCPAPAARSASRASSARARAIELMVEGTKPRRRARAAIGLVNKVWTTESHDELHAQGHRLRARVLPAERARRWRSGASSARCRAASR